MIYLCRTFLNVHNPTINKYTRLPSLLPSVVYTFDSFTLYHSILLPDIQPHLSPPPFCTNENIDCNRKTIYRGYNWSMRTLCLKERFFVYFPRNFFHRHACFAKTKFADDGLYLFNNYNICSIFLCR